MRRKILLFLVCLLCFSHTTFANKPTTPPKDRASRLHLRSDLALTFNGWGLRFQQRVGYEWRLYKADHLAFRDNFIRVQGLIGISPASADQGLYLVLQPATFLRFWAFYQHRVYFPVFTNNAFFQSIEQVHQVLGGSANPFDGDAKLQEQIAKTEQRLGGRPFYRSHFYGGGAMLRLKIGPIVALGQTRAFGYQASFSGITVPHVFYEPLWDSFVKPRDVIIDTIAFAGAQWKQFTFVLAVTHTYTTQAKYERLALGPAVLWQITKRWKSFKKPSLLLLSRWFVSHAWRKTAVPNVVLLLDTQFDWL